MLGCAVRVLDICRMMSHRHRSLKANSETLGYTICPLSAISDNGAAADILGLLLFIESIDYCLCCMAPHMCSVHDSLLVILYFLVRPSIGPSARFSFSYFG